MIRFLQASEMLLYVVACIFGGYRGISELRIALAETKPTAFTAADFATRHQGEQWVRVVGRVAVEHRDVRPSPYEVHKGKGLAYVTAPVVANDWEPTQPVHVLATFGPMPQMGVDAWSRTMSVGPRPVEGQLRPGGVRDPQAMFPQLRVSPSYVIINEGTKPNHWGTMALFSALMLVSGGLFAKRLRAAFKEKDPSL